MARWDWAGLVVIVTIGVGGHLLGLPCWLIGLFGAAYAARPCGSGLKGSDGPGEAPSSGASAPKTERNRIRGRLLAPRTRIRDTTIRFRKS